MSEAPLTSKVSGETAASARDGVRGSRGTLLVRISNTLTSMRRSEREVAELVLSDPAGVLQLSIARAAERAGVSQPSVARFAAALGFSGFREFKLRLAQSIASGVPYVHSDVRPHDTADVISSKVFDRAICALIDVRNHLDGASVAQAISRLERARRIECFGVGNSAIVAQDAQHKLVRFGIPCCAYADSHSMGVAASVLGSRDVVIAISASGRSLDLLENARTARANGAYVIAITGSATPLAALATLTLHTDVQEDTEVYTPMNTRLAHLVVIDALCVGFALKMGRKSIAHLETVKRNLRKRRSPREARRES